MHQHLSRLAGLLRYSADSDSPNLLASTVLPSELAEQIRGLADCIQEPAGRLARHGQPA